MSAQCVDEELVRKLDFGAALVDSVRIFFRLSPHFALAALLPFALASVFCACACCGSAVLVGVFAPENARDEGQLVGQVLVVFSLGLYMLLSFVPIAVQLQLVVGDERGARPSFFDAVRAVPRLAPVFVPVAMLVGMAFWLGNAFCVLPGILVVGLLGFAPALALREHSSITEALSDSMSLAQALGVRTYVPGILHAVMQALVFGLLVALSLAFESAGDDGAVAVAVFAVVGVLAWLAFSYGVVVLPAVLYARLTRVPGAEVDDLAEVFA
jgi:hypothetical protein